MTLVDTSKWVDHLRKTDPALSQMLKDNQVLSHSLVVGELAMGSVRDRETILHLISTLPPAVPARHLEVIEFVSRHRLFGLGIGFIDAHLLVSTQLTPGGKLWTRDKRLLQAAERLNLAYVP